MFDVGGYLNKPRTATEPIISSKHKRYSTSDLLPSPLLSSFILGGFVFHPLFSPFALKNFNSESPFSFSSRGRNDLSPTLPSIFSGTKLLEFPLYFVCSLLLASAIVLNEILVLLFPFFWNKISLSPNLIQCYKSDFQKEFPPFLLSWPFQYLSDMFTVGFSGVCFSSQIELRAFSLNPLVERILVPLDNSKSWNLSKSLLKFGRLEGILLFS